MGASKVYTQTIGKTDIRYKYKRQKGVKFDNASQYVRESLNIADPQNPSSEQNHQNGNKKLPEHHTLPC